jgi:hypothetical protein
MNMPKRKSLKQLQTICDKFNAAVRLRNEVAVKLDGGEILHTKTRSDAQVLSGHSPVIWLENVSGCYLLDRVTKLTEEEKAHRAMIDANTIVVLSQTALILRDGNKQDGETLQSAYSLRRRGLCEIEPDRQRLRVLVTITDAGKQEAAKI